MKTKTILLSFLLAFSAAAQAADSLVFKLWPNGAPEANGLSGPEQTLAGGRVANVSEPTLTVYKSFYPNGLAIIACPGGGYVRLAMNHEGRDMAKWMTQMGVTYGVLKYRMPNGHPAVPLDDAMQAMRIMKTHAAEWGVTSIGIMGASAGGHVASTLATHFTPDTRPDFQILLYPVISFLGMKEKPTGRPNPLLGTNPSEELIRRYSNELHVDSLTPPAFILMSSDDRTVSLGSVLDYYKALVANHVSATLHCYPDGGHGWGHKDSFRWKREWTGELRKWLSQMKDGTRNGTKLRETDPQKLSWRQVARSMPDSFYASREAQEIASRIIYYQFPSGGWMKNVNYHYNYTPQQMQELKSTLLGPTIDNESTTQEMKFLARVYRFRQDKKWRTAFIHGVNYLLNAQYANGGWPQFWPKKAIDNGLDYSTHITYNDDAMVNVMEMLKAISSDAPAYAPLKLDRKLKDRCREAFDKGISCILKTQIRVNGQPTVWCAQHDEVTLKPANARAYELASFSGAESVGIIELLMGIDHPSPEVICAVKGAVGWLQQHEIKGIKTERYINDQGMNEVRVVPAEGNTVWARFYDLDTQKPYFCGRDGVKRDNIYQIERERRAGYGWYTQAPARVLRAYPEWLKRVTAAR